MSLTIFLRRIPYTDGGSNRAVNMVEPGQLHQLLQQTLVPDPQVMASATAQLQAAETDPNFGISLLTLLQSREVDAAVAQAGAIYFKNYIKRGYGSEKISKEVGIAIKQNLLSFLLQSLRPVQLQMIAVIEQIAFTDFLDEYENLLPDIDNHLKTSQDPQIIKVCMEILDTVFMKFQKQMRTDNLESEVQYSLDIIQETHLMIFNTRVQQLLSNTMQGEHLVSHLELLTSTLSVFYSLNLLELPEFFEENREAYFSGFVALLTYTNAALSSADDESTPGPIENMKAQVCECLTLYATQYQEEYEPYVHPTVKGVWELLMQLGQEGKYDQLVAKGIKFIASSAAYRWEHSPFDDPNVLAGIVEKVVLPNIFLRESDRELFEDNPVEYIQQDMENADMDTRRRSAMDICQSLGKLNEAKVTAILVSYIKSLLDQASTAPPEQAEIFKETCIYLVIATGVRGSTLSLGVTMMNQNIDVLEFFNSHVAPDLLSGQRTKRTILQAAYLKFVTVFRNQIPKDKILAIFQPGIVSKLLHENAVVHSYAAICIDRILSVMDGNVLLPQTQTPRYNAADFGQSLLGAIEPMLQILSQGTGIPQNEYLMKTVSHIFEFMGQNANTVALTCLHHLSATVTHVLKNPVNANFNHNLFETIAAIVKILMPDKTNEIEAVLLPVCAEIHEKKVVEFLPYTYQIYGLLLHTSSNVNPLYTQLFTQLLQTELWQEYGNVAGLVRLLNAYFRKKETFASLLKENMEKILASFQFILGQRRTWGSGFDLLNAIVMWLPLEMYQMHLKTVLSLLFNKVQARKDPQVEANVALSLSLMAHRYADGFLEEAINSVQPGLQSDILQGIWLPALKVYSARMTPQEKKISSLGLAKVLSNKEVIGNSQLLFECCKGLNLLLEGFAGRKGKGCADQSTDPMAQYAHLLDKNNQNEMSQYEVGFSELKNAECSSYGLDLAPEVQDRDAVVKSLVQRVEPSILQLADANPGELKGLISLLRQPAEPAR